MYRQSKQKQTNKNKKNEKENPASKHRPGKFYCIQLCRSYTNYHQNVAPAAISKNVINSFNREFTNASDIQWESNANFVKAQFTINEMVLFAYFNKSGELIAVTRFISPNQFPLNY